MIMSAKVHLPAFFIASLITLDLFLLCRADVGTAASYSPPYLPSECYGNEATEFPSSNLFAAAGDGIWDNGAACGRQYLVRCISAEQPRTCIPDQNIQIKIVDYAASAVSPASTAGTTLVLSDKGMICQLYIWLLCIRMKMNWWRLDRTKDCEECMCIKKQNLPLRCLQFHPDNI